MISKTILVPTDFSDTAQHGMNYAFTLAQTLGAKVSLLHVYVIPEPPEAGGLAGEFVHETQQGAQKKLDLSVAKHRDSPAFGRTLLSTGNPSEAIVNTAREIGADLVVIGTHGRRGVRRMLLGSVAESVLRAAACPVLAVRLPAER